MAELMDILVAKAGLPPSAVTDDESATAADLDLDSLARLQLQIELADRYGVEIDAGRPDATFGEILAAVNGEPSEYAR